MRKVWPLGFLILCLFPHLLPGQQVPLSEVADPEDTLFHLPAVRLNAPRHQHFAFAHRSQRLDTVAGRQVLSLGELLGQHSTLFLKQYHPGGLATATFRGTGPEHTAVLWNGMPLQSPMNGQVDLNLIPGMVADRMLVQHGGGGALWGSGAVGGSIHLDNTPRFGLGWELGSETQWGSFGRWGQNLSLHHGSPRVFAGLRYYHLQAQNDFPFRNAALAGQPEMRQSHAALANDGALATLAFRLSPRHTLSMHGWWQDTDRRLPPLMIQATSRATQHDRSLRSQMAWDYVFGGGQLRVRGGYQHERLDYADPASRVDARNEAQTYRLEAETFFYRGERHRLHLGLMAQHAQARAGGYGDRHPEYTEWAAFAGYRYQSGQWLGSLNVRIPRDPFTPSGLILPAFSFRYLPHAAWTVSGQVGKNFRAPTFNERFWVPGGKPDIRPESGWSEDLGLTYSHPFFRLHLSLFNAVLEDRILWQPAPQNGVWEPQNLQQVWSRGIEATLSGQYTGSFGKILPTLDYTYTLATTGAFQPGQILAGSQLPHVPLHRGRAAVTLERNRWQMTYQHQFTSGRFTTLDHSFSLPGFHLGSFSAQIPFSWRKTKGTLGAQVNNIWGKSYQVLPWRPMPLQHFLMTFSLFFRSPPKPVTHP